MNDRTKEIICKIIILLITSLFFIGLGIALIINTARSELDIQTKSALYSVSSAFISVGIVFLKKI